MAGKWLMQVFLAIVIGGLIYVGYAISQDPTSAVAVPGLFVLMRALF